MATLYNMMPGLDRFPVGVVLDIDVNLVCVWYYLYFSFYDNIKQLLGWAIQCNPSEF